MVDYESMPIDEVKEYLSELIQLSKDKHDYDGWLGEVEDILDVVLDGSYLDEFGVPTYPKYCYVHAQALLQDIISDVQKWLEENENDNRSTN